MKTTLSILTSCIAAALIADTSATAQTYTVTPINPPPGTATCSPQSMNNLGHVVGSTRVKVGKNYALGPAFIWENGQSTTLPPLSGQSAAEAAAISDSGLIVGGPNLLSNLQTGRAIWWEQTSGGYEPRNWNSLLPQGSGLTLLRADAISHDGRYIAFEAEIGGDLRSIIAEIALDPSGPLPLGIVAFWDVSTAWGVSEVHHDGNGLVQAPGFADSRAFLWTKDASGNTQTNDLHSSTDQATSAWGVNGSGEVVGSSRNSTIDRAARWASGVMQDIGTLGGTEAVARSINDAGYVVGWADTGGRRSVAHAFLWHPSTGMRDLNSLKSSPYELTSASKINNTGQILATGTTKTQSGPVLLSPIAP